MSSYRIIHKATLILGILFTSTSFGMSPPVYETNDSFLRSGYEYLWTVIQDEFDSKQFASSGEAENYRQMISLVLQTGVPYGQPFREEGQGLKELYPKIQQLDPDPPLLIQYRYHSSQPGDDRPDQDFLSHGKAILQIASKMEEAQYPKYISAAAWLRGYQFLRDANIQTDETDQAREHGMELLVEAASLNETDEKYQEFVALRISQYGSTYTTLLSKDKERLCKQFLKDKNANPWIARYSSGILRSLLGYKARGIDWAQNVTSEQWETMERHLVKAEMHLTKAWELEPNWPYPAFELISVSMGRKMKFDRDSYFWFEQVIATRLNYPIVFTQFGLAISPRWGGSYENEFALLDDLIELSKENDSLDYAVIDLMFFINKDMITPYGILTYREYLDYAKDLFLAKATNHSSFESVWAIRTALRTLANGYFFLKEYETSVELLQAGGGFYDQTLYGWPKSRRFNMYATVLTTPVSDLVIEGLRASDSGNIKVARKKLNEALKQLEKMNDKLDPEIEGNPIRTLKRLIKEL